MPFKLLLVSGFCLAAVATAMDDKGYASIYESIAAFENRTGGDAWGLLQEQIISNLHDENGKTFGHDPEPPCVDYYGSC